MNLRPIRSTLAFCLLALLMLALAACGPESMRPTPTATPPGTGTPESVRPDATTLPTRAAPTREPTPIPATPTETEIPTETPQPTFVSTPGVLPTTIVAPGINVAKEEYDAARARWDSQSIEEYEVEVEHRTLSPWAGTWVLHVSEGGEKVDITSFTGNSGVPTTPAMHPESVKFLTVEQQFAAIEHVLTAGIFSELETLVDYVVTFDDTLGYPASIEIKTKPNVRSSDLGSSTVVKRLTVIRRGTPVAPSPALTVEATVEATIEASPSP